MPMHIGLENYGETYSIAWVLDHPGCFASGLSSEMALDAVPEAIQAYAAWVHQKDNDPWLPLSETDYLLEETFQVYSIDEQFELADKGYEVNAWFLHDWKPLTSLDVERGQKILSWSRERLLALTRNLSAEGLDAVYPGERWSIKGILNHISNAEWWYMDRLGLVGPRADLPKDTFTRLDAVRATLNAALPELVAVKRVAGVDGEFWSPRKLLRRAAWHELDHITHIRRLLES